MAKPHNVCGHLVGRGHLTNSEPLVSLKENLKHLMKNEHFGDLGCGVFNAMEVFMVMEVFMEIFIKNETCRRGWKAF